MIFLDHWLLWFLLFIIFVSLVGVEYDPEQLGVKRTMLTFWVVMFALVFVAVTADNFPTVLIKACIYLILLQSVFVVIQFMLVYSYFELPGSVEAHIDLRPGSIFNVLGYFSVPRFRGVVADPNRSASLLSLLLGFCYFSQRYKLSKSELPVWIYILGIILIFATLSRTGVVALALVVFMAVAQRRKTLGFWNLITFYMIFIPIAVIWVLSDDSMFDVFRDTFVRSHKESTSVHLTLIGEGIDLWLNDAKTFLLGTGWGTAYAYTQEYFPDSKYGNFHSGFVSVAAQSGILALVAMTLYMIRPYLRKLMWREMTLVFIWVNIFYQFSSEPLYWVLLVAQNSSIFKNFAKANAYAR